jgi:3-oxoadipate enol-lactonase
MEVRIAGLEVACLGAGQPLVLLHGLGDDHTLWRRVAPALAATHEVHLVDLPGHGRSEPAPDGAMIGWYAERVAEVVRAVAAQTGARPVLAGLSMGGGIAQYVALAMPSGLRGLILVSTSPAFSPAKRERFLERAARAEREGMAAVLDATVPRWFTDGFRAARPDEVARTAATVAATDPVQFARASRANAARDCTARLGEIGCPVLFVGGLDDPAGAADAAAVYRAGLRDVRIELLAHASHLIPVETPERFVPLVRSFLDRLPEEQS